MCTKFRIFLFIHVCTLSLPIERLISKLWGVVYLNNKANHTLLKEREREREDAKSSSMDSCSGDLKFSQVVKQK